MGWFKWRSKQGARRKEEVEPEVERVQSDGQPVQPVPERAVTERRDSESELEEIV